MNVMHSVADRYKAMLADLSQRVPLVCLETANGRYVRVVTGSGIPVATLSREFACAVGVASPPMQPKPLEVGVAPLLTIQWQPTHTADTALKPLLDSSGHVEHISVRLAPGRYPPQRPHLRIVTFAIVGGAGCFLDPTSARMIDGRVTAWALCERPLQ